MTYHIKLGLLKTIDFSRIYDECDLILCSKYTTTKFPAWTSLRSHEIDNIVILVKNGGQRKFTNKSSFILVLLLIMLSVCTFLRKLFRTICGSPHRSIIHTALDTFGIFLATNTNFMVRNRPEHVMNLSILLLSILISKFSTATIMTYILAERIDSGIDTLEELSQMNLPIFITDEMVITMDEWSESLP